jgi:hypothetical protein
MFLKYGPSPRICQSATSHPSQETFYSRTATTVTRDPKVKDLFDTAAMTDDIDLVSLLDTFSDLFTLLPDTHRLPILEPKSALHPIPSSNRTLFSK